MFDKHPKITLQNVINGLSFSLMESQKISQNMLLEYIDRWTTNNKNVKKPRMMLFERGNKTENIPIISLLPTPNLEINEMEVGLQLNIKSIDKIKNNSNDDLDIEVSYGETSKGEIPLKINIKFKQKDIPNALRNYLENIS